MTWIKPDNQNLAVITGSVGGLGLNPLPLSIGIISVLCFNHFKFHFYPLNNIIGMFLHSFVLLVFGILIINGQDICQSTIMDFSLTTGERYSVALVVDKDSLFDNAKYRKWDHHFILR